jgi:hypothetical protein
MSKQSTDPLLHSARREMRLALIAWAAACCYTLTVCVWRGYGRDLERDPLTFVLGFPDWVFWGIIVPWAAATLFAAWFAFRFMKDEALE